MKAINKLAVLLSLSALLPFVASAKTPEEAYLETAAKVATPTSPVPVAVVSPTVSANYVGSTVELAFTVDAKGSPTAFKIVSSPDAMIAKIVQDAVSKWRFTPGSKDGSPVAKKVLLPVHISDSDAFVAN